MRHLRTTFDEAAELYERARPSYPLEVFDDVAELARLRPGSRVVEIGCGTGQATFPLAQRNLEITCVELGAHLAAAARRNLKKFANVEVIESSFEAWEPTRREFDAVLAFTAFHWVDPDVRYAKSASLLRDSGALAVVAVHHVLPADGDPFFHDVQEDYEAVVPDDPKTRAGAPRPPEDIEDLSDDIDASGLFDNVAARRYVWDVEYTADEYVALLNTYSGHRALQEAAREELLARIAHRVSARPGGVVRKAYLATLNVAAKAARGLASLQRGQRPARAADSGGESPAARGACRAGRSAARRGRPRDLDGA